MAIFKYLDCSTACVTKETMDNMPHLIADYEYGCFVFVPEDFEEEDLPADLLRVFEYAQTNNCWLIRFDSDADVIDGLPTYDW